MTESKTPISDPFNACLHKNYCCKLEAELAHERERADGYAAVAFKLQNKLHDAEAALEQAEKRIAELEAMIKKVTE